MEGEDSAMRDSISKEPHNGSFDLVVGWLDERDQTKREVAASILLGVGKPVVEFLILEAAKPDKRSEHRVRLLDLVQQIGGPLGPAEFFKLQALLRDHAPTVRRKAEEVIMSMSPCGVPDNAESLALSRAFNPFLRLPPSVPHRRTRLSDFQATCRGDLAAARRRQRSQRALERKEQQEQGRRL
jgi:hypothetical protein